MGTAESLDPFSGLWTLLAVQLRKQRQRRRVSQAAVGVLVRADHKTVSNWEAGRNHPPVEALRTLDREWDTGHLLEALYHYARTMQAPTRFRAAAEYEAVAAVIRVNGMAFIPGLLQTAEYARQAFVMAGEQDVEGQVSRRLERQAVFGRENPPYVSILLAEMALVLTPNDLRAAQYGKLLETANLPHVSLRVVPLNAGLHVGLAGDFWLFSTPERELGFVETPARGRLVTETDDLRTLSVKFDRIGGYALSSEATRAKLQEMIEASSDDVA